MYWRQVAVDTYQHLRYYFTDVGSTIWGSIVGLFLFMIGEPNLAFYAIFTLFILDIVTRVFANARKYGGYINATKTGKIRSRLAVQGMVSKLFTYFVVLSIARMITYVIPISLLSEGLSSMILSVLLVVEIQSLFENLLDAKPDKNTRMLLNILLLKFRKEINKVSDVTDEEIASMDRNNDQTKTI
ncbi:Bacteriophage holin family protein [Paenibacillus sophorae]|uniref:Phage holin family protein n=1 Tax=Paenibacillus sophorae TaxID=1333845 RepID=A0A1H8H9R3_9BACL|nr:phage holin family protein [Paenibacillus sophorae]QWU14471.1 phage holin family protein [Paenibacillus sophorae]SEN52248.1 Bacteriophage holin family protein [Paenibacillus sophorae]